MEQEEAREELARQYNLPGGMKNLEVYATSLTGTLREYAGRLLKAIQEKNNLPHTRIWILTPSLIEKLTG